MALGSRAILPLGFLTGIWWDAVDLLRAGKKWMVDSRWFYAGACHMGHGVLDVLFSWFSCLSSSLAVGAPTA